MNRFKIARPQCGSQKHILIHAQFTADYPPDRQTNHKRIYELFNIRNEVPLKKVMDVLNLFVLRGNLMECKDTKVQLLALPEVGYKQKINEVTYIKKKQNWRYIEKRLYLGIYK